VQGSLCTLAALTLARQWQTLRQSLSPTWGDLRLLLRVRDPAHAERANGLLAPLTSGRNGDEIRFGVSRRSGPGPEAVRRLLSRLDAEGIVGELEVVAVVDTEPEPRGSETLDLPAARVAKPLPAADASPLAPQWDDAIALLPPDWTDVYAEVEITSSDLLDRVALLMGPLNPARDGERLAFRFRCARSFGYGASPGMVQRCLERVDAERIPGTFRLLRALSDTKPVYTQGPVWYVGGKAV
jgi:hypothetical protein